MNTRFVTPLEGILVQGARRVQYLDMRFKIDQVFIGYKHSGTVIYKHVEIADSIYYDAILREAKYPSILLDFFLKV